jgi:hypothetical protein
MCNLLLYEDPIDGYSDSGSEDDNDIENRQYHVPNSVTLPPLPPMPAEEAKRLSLSAFDAKHLVVQHLAAFIASTPKQAISNFRDFKASNKHLGALIVKHAMKPKKTCDEFSMYLRYSRSKIMLAASYSTQLSGMNKVSDEVSSSVTDEVSGSETGEV